MSLFLVTAPSVEPVSLEELKLHLRVDHDTEDDLIAGLNVSGRQYAEAFTQRAIPQQTFDLKWDGFPCGDEFYLPKAPCISVTAITYIDQNGDVQTVPTSVYDVDLPVGPHARAGRVFLKYGQSWPSARCIPNAVTVRFVAGYSGTPVTLTSLTQSAGVATATVSSGHGLTNLQMVTIAGANQAGYNGSFTATVVSSTVFTFPVASGTVSPATGTVTVTGDPVPAMVKICIKEHARANYVRGAFDPKTVMDWIHTQLWPFRSF